MDISAADAVAAEMEQDRLAREAEADLGHDYDGPELQSGTAEYAKSYAEYLDWVATWETTRELELEL